jgi:hypothetical protein
VAGMAALLAPHRRAKVLAMVIIAAWAFSIA